MNIHGNSITKLRSLYEGKQGFERVIYKIIALISQLKNKKRYKSIMQGKRQIKHKKYHFTIYTLKSIVKNDFLHLNTMVQNNEKFIEII